MSDNERGQSDILGGVLVLIFVLAFIAFWYIKGACDNPTFGEDFTALCKIGIPYLFVVGFPVILIIVAIIFGKTTAAGIRLFGSLFRFRKEKNDEEDSYSGDFDRRLEAVDRLIEQDRSMNGNVRKRRTTNTRLPPLKKGADE